MEDHVVEFIDNPLLVNSRGAGAACQHAGAATRRQRRLWIDFSNQAAHPKQIIGETVLVETRPIVPDCAVRVRQWPRVFDWRGYHLAEALVSGRPLVVGSFHPAVFLSQPIVEHPLASFAVADVHQLVRFDVV